MPKKNPATRPARPAQPRFRRRTLGAPLVAAEQSSRNLAAEKRTKIPLTVLAEVDPVGAAIRNVYSPDSVPPRPVAAAYPGAIRAAVEAALKRTEGDDELVDALTSILDMRTTVSRVVSARNSQSGSESREDALNKTLRELLVNNPEMTEKEILNELYDLASHEHDVVQEIIDHRDILWKSGTGRTKHTLVTALKDRVSRVRRTLP